MPFTVYILFSESHKRHYIGQTMDINNRIQRHNAGFEKATAPYKPWVILWTTVKANRAEAMALEKKLKNLSTKRLIQFIIKYA